MSASRLRVLWLNALEHIRVCRHSALPRLMLGGQEHVENAPAYTPSRRRGGRTDRWCALPWRCGGGRRQRQPTRTAKDQEQLIDPQAPVGTEAKSARSVTAKTEVDSPVQTTAADPDSASDLQKLASTDGGRWTKTADIARRIQRIPPDHGAERQDPAAGRIGKQLRRLRGRHVQVLHLAAEDRRTRGKEDPEGHVLLGAHADE